MMEGSCHTAMRILYLSRDMAGYKSASYQQDVIQALQEQASLIMWGPGFPGFRADVPLSEVIARHAMSTADTLCIGHSWLSDSADGELESCGALDLDDFPGKKVFILNKEYVRLEEKLAFAKRWRFDLALSHHQDAESFADRTGVQFVFWPFAVDASSHTRGGLPKRSDLFFSGLLKNPSHPDAQSDLRVRTQRALYVTYGELRLFRRFRYRGFRLFWNAYSGDPRITRVLRVLGKYRRLGESDYVKQMALSRSVFCTLSPAKLISPRYFEAMYAGAIVLCEESGEYRRLFQPWVHYVPFSADLSDFEEKLRFACSDSEQVSRIRSAAESLVANYHTWQRRVVDLVTWIRTGEISNLGVGPY
jgi:hypothetical protein